MEKWLLYNLKEQLNVFLRLFCRVWMKPERFQCGWVYLGRCPAGRESKQTGQSRKESWELAAQTSTELPS